MHSFEHSAKQFEVWYLFLRSSVSFALKKSVCGFSGCWRAMENRTLLDGNKTGGRGVVSKSTC